MCRWIALVILTVLYKNISSEPIPDNGNNDRFTRQLVFEESCSCEEFDKSLSRRDARYDDTVATSSDSDFLRSRDVDDCPCRFRETDSQGASSLLFPTALRSAGNFLRPVEKKEELKPFFNPEVDLASSVLETIRIATDEEYQDALARDAAKNEARAVEDIMFGDTTPQESANVVTVVVKAKAEDIDDIVPQASHIKQSRCIHPLGRASKPLLNLNTPRLSTNARKLDRNAYYLDSDIGASSVHEHMKPINEEESPRLSVNRLDIKAKANNESNTPIPIQNKMKIIGSGSSLLQSIRNKTLNTLSKIPKLNLQDLIPDKLQNDNNDLTPASSLIQKQAVARIPFSKPNLKYDYNKQNRRPLTLTNLLNLKDVELVPLKDFISKQAKINKFKKPQVSYPSEYHEYDDVLPNEKAAKVTERWITTQFPSPSPVEDSIGDAEFSPTRINLQIGSNDIQTTDESSCGIEKASLKNINTESPNRPFLTEIRDSDTNNLPPITTVIDESSCLQGENNDSITDASNYNDSIINRAEINPLMDSSTPNIIEQDTDPKNTKNDHKTKSLDIISLDKTISKISNYILKTQEDLNNMKSNLINKNSFNQADRLNNKLKVFTTPKYNNHIDDATNSNLNKLTEVVSSLNEYGEIEGLVKNEANDIEKAVIVSLVANNISDPETSPSLKNTRVISKDSMPIVSDNSENKNEALEANSRESDNELHSKDYLENLTTENVVFKSILGNDNSCFEDQNSDVSNNSINVNDQSGISLSENKKVITDNSAMRITGDSNELDDSKNPLQQLLRPIAIEKTRSTIKNFILKKQEDFRNIRNDIRNKNLLNQNSEDDVGLGNEEQDSENQRPLQINTLQNNYYNNLEMSTTFIPMLEDITTTLKPIVTQENVYHGTGENTDVSMQDLQKISDAMLQQEEAQLFESKVEASDTMLNVIPNENNILDEQSTSSSVINLLQNPLKHISDTLNLPQRHLLPVVDDMKAKLINWVEKKENHLENVTGYNDSYMDYKSSNEQDLDNSELTTNVVIKPENVDRFQDKSNEIENCQTELASHIADSDSDGSNKIVSIIPNKNNFLGIQTTTSPVVNLMKDSQKDLRYGIKLPQLTPLVGDRNAKLMNLFDSTIDDIEDTSRLAVQPKSESFDILNTAMESDASTAHFQLKNPLRLSEGFNLDGLRSKLQSNVLNFFPKITDKDLNFKPFALKSTLLDKRYNILQSSQRQYDLNDILNISPNLHDVTNRLIEGPNKAIDNIQSALKNTKDTFESKLRTLNNNNFNALRSSIKNSPSLFDTFSQNNEDLNDKLKAIHMDLNDRLETMRNNLIDRSNLLTTGFTTIKPKFRSASDFPNQNKSKQSKHSRTNKKGYQNVSPKKKTPVKIPSPPNSLDQKKFRMSTAASVPVPKTVQIPILKTANSAKSPPMTSRTSSSFNNFGQVGTFQQPSFLRSNSNMKKDNSIKISFSTTPLPAILNTHKSRSIDTSRGKFDSKKMFKDYSVSPRNEVQETKIATHEEHQDVNGNPDLISSKLVLPAQPFAKKINPLLPRTKNLDLNILQSRLIARERDIPSKIKDGLRMRLARVNSAKSLQKPSATHDYEYQDVDGNPKTEQYKDLLSNKLVLPAEPFAKKNNPLLPRYKNLDTSLLQSGLMATKSEIPSKIKDDLRTRLARVNSAKLLQKPIVTVDEARENKELSMLTSEMAQSASENKEIIDPSMKENVSYKCKMICTKEGI